MNFSPTASLALMLLGEDAEFRAELVSALERLAPLQISEKTGRLQEWVFDYDEPEPGHRHMSHMYGLHPSCQITLRGTPELAAAAKKSLEYRLAHGGGTHGMEPRMAHQLLGAPRRCRRGIHPSPSTFGKMHLDEPI